MSDKQLDKIIHMWWLTLVAVGICLVEMYSIADKFSTAIALGR